VKKITNWCNKGLNLEEIASKLESTKAIRTGSIDELSKKLQSDYFNQVGVGIGDLLNTSIGQGDNAYTPIQMANYMATLGDEGRLKGVSILLSADSETTEDSQVISQCSREDLTNIDTVLQAMKQVTTSRGGSLQGVFAGFPYETLAKTGTAQRAGFINVEDEENYLRVYLHLIAPDVSYEDVIDESERLTSLYPEFYRSNIQALRRAIINLSSYKITADDIDRFKETYDNFAWTVALAPADDPEIAIAVMLVQGVTATNSAPVVREIIGSYGESKGWDK
jgi:penicillin-binding protein 2